MVSFTFGYLSMTEFTQLLTFLFTPYSFSKRETSYGTLFISFLFSQSFSEMF